MILLFRQVSFKIKYKALISVLKDIYSLGIYVGKQIIVKEDLIKINFTMFVLKQCRSVLIKIKQPKHKFQNPKWTVLFCWPFNLDFIYLPR